MGWIDPDEIAGRPLTIREHQVVAEYFAHYSAKQAAFCLGISDQTFKNHLSMVYRKLDVGTIVEASARLGWLTIPETHRCEVVRTVTDFPTSDAWMERELRRISTILEKIMAVAL